MRRPIAIAVGSLVAVVVWAAPAEADSTVVVRGLDFPEGSTGLSIASCTGMFDAVDEPVTTYLSRSPDTPAGTRSLKYDLTGGNAVGSQHQVASMATTTLAGLSLDAAEGASGVAYAAYQAPADSGTPLIWVGRAALDGAPGGWRAVDAVALTYTWTQYDLATMQAASAAEEPLTVAAFVAEHGDGPGLFSVGFGCDGRPFRIDALRLGSAGDVTTYDLEGFTSTTSITGSATRIVAGDPVTLEGSLRDNHGNPLPHGLLILEAQPYGEHGFTPVDGAAEPVGNGDPRVTVHPETRTVYRWRFVGTWSVDGSISATFTVEVGSVVTATVDAGIGDGGPLVITGRATPGGPHGSATLSHLGADGRSVVATARIGDDGTFRFEVRDAAPGQYVVSVPAGDGTLGGESAVLVVAAPPSPDPTPTPDPTLSPDPTPSPSPSDGLTATPSDPATPSATDSATADPTP